MNAKRKSHEKIDFKTFVDTYNLAGKQAAVKYVTDNYSLKYDTVVRRLKKESEYMYNQRRDRYVLKSEAESPFLSMDELCKTKNQNNSIDTNDIIFSLIKDKFFEISKFVTLEQSSRKIFFKLEAAKNAGYEIEYT